MKVVNLESDEESSGDNDLEAAPGVVEVFVRESRRDDVSVERSEDKATREQLRLVCEKSAVNEISHADINNLWAHAL